MSDVETARSMTGPDDPNGYTAIHHAPLGALIGPDATTAGLRERDRLWAEMAELRAELEQALAEIATQRGRIACLPGVPGESEIDALRAEVAEWRAGCRWAEERAEDLCARLTDAIRRHRRDLQQVQESLDRACASATRLRAVLSDIATVVPGTYAGSVAREALLDELTVGAAKRAAKKSEVKP